jgi:Tfp pilus assembly protein PilV
MPPPRQHVHPTASSPISRRSLGAGGFTIVEVMMASVILVVGFIGMISALTVGSEMMATARRQNLAAQIINHELEKLRLLPWDVTDTSPNELCINDLAAGPTTITIDPQFTTSIAACGLTTITADSTNPFIKLERSVSDVVSGSMRQITFTVTWQKSGTTTVANTASGSWLQKLSLGGNAPIRRTYVRKGVGFYGKYGLNLSAQRS